MARGAARPAADSDKLAREEEEISVFSAEDSVAELNELATSAGAEVVGQFLQRRDKPDPATLVGSGKLLEIAGAAASAGADVILFDHDLTPSQQRNIEHDLKRRVIDRTQLILDIFARHARTREGQLQVELAQLEYLLPRLTGRGVSMSQLGGGIGTRGPGETKLETDRRRIYRRIRHVKEKLEEVRRHRARQRQRRESVPVATVALVGYTNAGKSTLFNALTHAGVLSSPRLFATLDPTLRSVELPSKRKALLSDTVGFIRNLPHGLVTSFRATLEEVERAALVLHVADASVPDFIAEEQKAQVEKVLAELGADKKPRLLVLNKVDLLSAEQRRGLPAGDAAVQVSAAKSIGLDDLFNKIDSMLATDPVVTVKLRVPQSEGKVLAALEARTRILKRAFRGGNVYLQVVAPESLARTWQRFAAKP
ncbi:MAG: GTPase HflX [Acidobacteriales bacterium]|nr:GTPase HflX [Terriglobales bacterium]